MVAAPTPKPAIVGQSVPVSGIGLDVSTGATVAPAVGVGEAVEQVQLVEEVHRGFRQKPPVQIFPELQLALLVQESLHSPGAGDSVGDGEGDAVGLEEGLALGLGLGDGDGEAQALMFLVQAAPGAGQQY